MKCPRCWSDRAYLRRVTPWKRFFLGCLLLVPLRCQHCYHEFNVLWFSTIGKVVEAPRLRIAPMTRGSRLPASARRVGTGRAGPSIRSTSHRQDHRRDTRRADAA